MEPKETFKRYLRSEGLKFTPEREAVLRQVARLKGHFDLEELYLTLRRSGAKVSRASIYRTVPLMVRCALLEEVERVEKHAHYERTFGRRHHDHMLCVRCGRVTEFYSGALERLQDTVCRKEGFIGQSHSLEIKGLCKHCAGK